MKPHKWAKEIHAWADGAEIEYKSIKMKNFESIDFTPCWDEDCEYRIKPQPKPDVYLYVCQTPAGYLSSSLEPKVSTGCLYIGKIKLEQDNE